MPVQVDLFYAPHCGACRRVRPRLRQLASRYSESILVRELDVLEHLDEAVTAGVRCTPSVVVGGRVQLAGAITESALVKLLEKLKGESAV